MRQSRAAKIAERRIDAAFRRHCCGIPINIMDIGKVFKVGYLAIEQGQDDAALGATLLAYVKHLSSKEGAR